MDNTPVPLRDYLPRLPLTLNGTWDIPASNNTSTAPYTHDYNPNEERACFLIVQEDLANSMMQSMVEHLQTLEAALQLHSRVLKNKYDQFLEDFDRFPVKRQLTVETSTSQLFTLCRDVMAEAVYQLYPGKYVLERAEELYANQRPDAIIYWSDGPKKIHVEYKRPSVFKSKAPRILNMAGDVSNVGGTETGAQAMFYKVQVIHFLRCECNKNT